MFLGKLLKIYVFKSVLLLLLLYFIIVNNSLVLAGQSKDPEKLSDVSNIKDTKSPADTNTVSTSKPLTKAEINTLLANMYTTLNHLHSVSLDLQNEASQTQYDGSDLMTSAMVMQPLMGGPSAPPYVNKVSPDKDFSNVLPVRRKWVKYTYRQLLHLEEILNEEFSQLSLAEFKDNPKMSSYLAQCNVFSDSLESVKNNIDKVRLQIAQSKYDNKTLFDCGRLIGDDSIGMNEIRKRMIKDIKKFQIE